MMNIKEIAVHHSGISFQETFASIKRYHTSPDPSDPSKPWIDIGYNFVIEADGTIKEGRLLTIPGAHTIGHNTTAIGICLVGNLDKALPKKEQLESLTKLLDELTNKYNISKDNVFCHRDLYKTICPGRYLADFIQKYKQSVNISLTIKDQVLQKIGEIEELVKKL